EVSMDSARSIGTMVAGEGPALLDRAPLPGLLLDQARHRDLLPAQRGFARFCKRLMRFRQPSPTASSSCDVPHQCSGPTCLSKPEWRPMILNQADLVQAGVPTGRPTEPYERG